MDPNSVESLTTIHEYYRTTRATSDDSPKLYQLDGEDYFSTITALDLSASHDSSMFMQSMQSVQSNLTYESEV